MESKSEFICYSALQYLQEMHLEWLRADDLWEPLDQEHLDNPNEYILNRKGKLVGIIIDGTLAATIAMKPVESTRWEIMKLAVSPIHKRKGMGDIMLRYAIDHCTQEMKLSVVNGCVMGGNGTNREGVIQLDSSSKLHAALKLYEKYGFVSIEGFESRYETADVFMELNVPLL
jgi:ribosomal protein S18 acetylase RimI-like enzyme